MKNEPQFAIFKDSRNTNRRSLECLFYKGRRTKNRIRISWVSYFSRATFNKLGYQPLLFHSPEEAQKFSDKMGWPSGFDVVSRLRHYSKWRS